MYFIVLVTTQQKKCISYYFRMLLKNAFNLIDSLNFNKKNLKKKNIKKLMQSYTQCNFL